MREPQWLRQLLVGSYLRNTRGGGSKAAAGRPVRRQQQGSQGTGDTRRGETGIQAQRSQDKWCDQHPTTVLAAKRVHYTTRDDCVAAWPANVPSNTGHWTRPHTRIGGSWWRDSKDGGGHGTPGGQQENVRKRGVRGVLLQRHRQLELLRQRGL